MTDNRFFTLNSIIRHDLISDEVKAFLNDYINNYNKVKIAYASHFSSDSSFSGLKQKERKDISDPKSLLNYRTFRGVEKTVKGLSDSQKQNNKNYINNTNAKIKNLEAEIKKLKLKKENLVKSLNVEIAKNMTFDSLKKTKFSLKQKSLKLNRLKQKRDSLIKNKNNFKVCFGGYSLLKKRYSIHKNDLQQINLWKEDWNHARYNEIMFVGSTDEVMGNDNCHIYRENNQYYLRIRVPESMKGKEAGLYDLNLVTLPISFNYKNQYYKNLIDNFLLVHEQQNKNERKTSGLKNCITIKINKTKKNDLYVHVTFEAQAEKNITTKEYGVIAVDINPDHIAVVELDKKGNKVKHFTVDLPLKDKSTNQRKDLIFNAVLQIVNYAEKQSKSVVIENLDFTKKKDQLMKNRDKKYANMLSSFSYSAITYAFESQSFRNKVELIKVNPAYTSQIGEIKYATIHGLSIHESAAMVIGRRGMGFKEKLPDTVIKVSIVKKDNHVTYYLEKIGHAKLNFSQTPHDYLKKMKKGKWEKLDFTLEKVIPRLHNQIHCKAVANSLKSLYIPFHVNDQI